VNDKGEEGAEARQKYYRLSCRAGPQSAF